MAGPLTVGARGRALSLAHRRDHRGRAQRPHVHPGRRRGPRERGRPRHPGAVVRRRTRSTSWPTHGRGLICLALTERARATQLGLPLMAQRQRVAATAPPSPSRSRRARASTPASRPHDRARTVAVAIDPRQGPRRHRLAGPRLPADARATAACWSAPATPRPRSTSRASPASTPPGVICEIMNDDGTMARLPDLVALRPAARPQDRHHRRPDRLSAAQRPLVERDVATTFDSRYGGDFRLHASTRNALDGGRARGAGQGRRHHARAGAGARARGRHAGGPARHGRERPQRPAARRDGGDRRRRPRRRRAPARACPDAIAAGIRATPATPGTAARPAGLRHRRADPARPRRAAT